MANKRRVTARRSPGLMGVHDKEISLTASGPQEKGDGQIFQVSSGSIFKMTRDHFHAFLSLGFGIHPIENGFEKSLSPNIS